MTTYVIKLVNHTGATDRLRTAIKTNLQDLFNMVFSGFPDSAVVVWGNGEAADAIVIHFVNDIASSYLQQQMPGTDIRGDAGGHTRTRKTVTGSEIYMHAEIGGRRTTLQDSAYARLAFHEALHNQFPGWSNADMHGPDGGDGLAASPPHLPMTDKNKELMRRGIAIKNDQLL